jgi:hypothetical protein
MAKDKTSAVAIAQTDLPRREFELGFVFFRREDEVGGE